MVSFIISSTGEISIVAEHLAKKIRLLCWVMTSPSNLFSKARHVLATWGQRCSKTIFMTSASHRSDVGDMHVVQLPVEEGRSALWAKTKEAFKYMYLTHIDSYDWFVKADDDTYMVVENLRYLLHDKDPSLPLYMGRRFKPYVEQGYMSGGAGYVLSKEAVKRFVERALKSPECRQDGGGSEDVELGRCLQAVGVRIVDSMDKRMRERFHPFVPEHHLIPDILDKNMWYFTYNYYPPKQVGCIFY